MARTETELMTGWQFAIGETMPERAAFCDIFLPHDWAIDMPFSQEMEEADTQGFRDRWSIGWYQKNLHLAEKKPGYCYILEFGAVMENCTLWINGQLVGQHRYGYSTFRWDVTKFLQAGDNALLMRVDNTVHPADRWYSGCGIYRTVKLLTVEEKHFDLWEVVVTTQQTEDSAEVHVLTGVAGKVKAVLTERGTQTVVAQCDGQEKLTLSVANPKLWSADEPNLYDLELTLFDGDRACDTVSVAVGIRQVEFSMEKGMLVNDKREILKGLNVHQDIGCRGIAAKKEMWHQRLVELKKMGCNALRTAHHMFPAEFLDLCDELGFYVYEEPFDKWCYWSYERNFDDCWQEDTDSMVKRDRNHPSIIIWGTGNEETNQGQTSFYERLKMLCDYVRTLDNTRPITYAMKPHFWFDCDPEEEDPYVYEYAERFKYVKRIGDLVDILCCNYMDQWYPTLHEMIPDKLIIGTEVYQYFAGEPDNMQNFSEKIPSLVPQQLDYCIGSFIWTGIDYLGESALFPFKGRCNAPLRTNANHRALYYILQSYWHAEPMVHFSVMDYTLPDEGTKWHWSIPPFVDHWEFPMYYRQNIPFVIASNCEEVKVKLNDDEYLMPKPSDCPNRLITGFLPYQPGKVTVTGYVGGKAVCTHEVVTPGAAAKLSFEKATYEIPAEEGYEQLFHVRMLDAENNPIFRDNTNVFFRVEGDAEVLTVDNGDLSSNEPYSQNHVKLYQGQASVLLRFRGVSGEVTLYAETEGKETAVAKMIAK